MVAYSFKKRFVPSIQAGLGQQVLPGVIEPAHPKRQTIRAGHISRSGRAFNPKAFSPKGRKHAGPGDLTQLYCGMRTKQCFLIGVGRCTSIHSVILWVDDDDISVMIDGKLQSARKTRDFIRDDGFDGPKDMCDFWRAEHGKKIKKFQGVLIKWEPL